MLYPILAIVAGIVLSGYGINSIINMFTMLIWLHTRITFKCAIDEAPKTISYSISAMMTYVAAFGPPAGLALMFIGIKYLP